MQEFSPAFYNQYIDFLLKPENGGIPNIATAISIDINNVVDLLKIVPGIDRKDSGGLRFSRHVMITVSDDTKGVWYSEYLPDSMGSKINNHAQRSIYGVGYGGQITESARKVGVDTEAAFIISSVIFKPDGKKDITIKHYFFDKIGNSTALQANGDESLLSAITQAPLEIAEIIEVDATSVKEVWKLLGNLIDEMNKGYVSS